MSWCADFEFRVSAGMFGEMELHQMMDTGDDLGRRRRRTVITKSICDIGFIRYIDMRRLMEQYPLLAYRMKSFSDKRRQAELR